MLDITRVFFKNVYKISCKTDPLTFLSVVFKVVLCVALGIGSCIISAVDRKCTGISVYDR